MAHLGASRFESLGLPAAAWCGCALGSEGRGFVVWGDGDFLPLLLCGQGLPVYPVAPAFGGDRLAWFWARVVGACLSCQPQNVSSR
jgi:hypothetical protein